LFFPVLRQRLSNLFSIFFTLGDNTMSNTITTGPVHHVALTVSDVARSAQFYTQLLGFQKLMDLGPRILLGNGSLIVGLTPPPDPSQAIHGDRFNENRLGLDHLSFSVASRADLEDAARLLDEHSVQHGEVTDLDGLGISILALRDPDNIQIELTAPTA
jgi:catechol 2,3-dioxygenase-like lactoylglutathione lyase family enzyme